MWESAVSNFIKVVLDGKRLVSRVLHLSSSQAMMWVFPMLMPVLPLIFFPLIFIIYRAAHSLQLLANDSIFVGYNYKASPL